MARDSDRKATPFGEGSRSLCNTKFTVSIPLVTYLTCLRLVILTSSLQPSLSMIRNGYTRESLCRENWKRCCGRTLTRCSSCWGKLAATWWGWSETLEPLSMGSNVPMAGQTDVNNIFRSHRCRIPGSCTSLMLQWFPPPPLPRRLWILLNAQQTTRRMARTTCQRSTIISGCHLAVAGTEFLSISSTLQPHLTNVGCGRK